MAIQINKYNNSMIYTIRSPHTDKFYIGSTTQKLCKRFANHKSNYNAYVNNVDCDFVTSFKIIELGDSYIELLEEINCENKSQLEMREGELIRLHKDFSINKIMVGRNPKQYRIDNADKIKQYYIDNTDKIKQYYLDNTDKIKQKSKQNYLNNTDKIKQYNLDNTDKINKRRRQHRLDNPDKSKQYDKQHYLDNADKISKRRRQNRLDSKKPKINIAKEDYDLLIHCDKLMNLQYSYKKLIIV